MACHDLSPLEPTGRQLGQLEISWISRYLEKLASVSRLPHACSFLPLTAALVLGSCGTKSETPLQVVSVDEGGYNRDGLAAPDTEVVATMDAGTSDDVSQGTSTGDSSDTDVGTTCEACSYGEVTALGAIPAKLVELSGLAPSHLHPGVLYAHNDSGDTARFFAINDKAQITAEMDLTGAIAIDWEDVAVGPCPSGSCVYLGDIGDNAMARAEYTIYRVAEPDVLSTDGSSSPVTYERFPFVYPDGKHNAETLLVHPSGRVFVVVKVMGVGAGIYEMPSPLTPGVQATLQRVSAVTLGTSGDLITGGSFHPCGNRLLLRTYRDLYELTNPSAGGGDEGGIEAVFQAPPVKVPVASEAQGEAVTYSLDGRGYFTSSETVGTPPAQLSRVGCL
jgi:hypothetical protein